jgi:Ala-tRNA(Pro) deacylase
MPATRDDLFARLDALGIATTTVEHAALFTVEQSKALRGDLPGGHCKNLFLKDKKGALWLVVTLEDAAVDLKALPALIGAARISFGNAALLEEVLGVTPGSVTPFGLINDTAQRVTVVLDQAMMARDLLNYHPLVNDATTAIAPADLLAFIRSCGHEPRIVAVAQ